MFEYKIIFVKKADKAETELNKLAREGWVVSCSVGKGSLVLKRKLKFDEEE